MKGTEKILRLRYEQAQHNADKADQKIYMLSSNPAGVSEDFSPSALDDITLKILSVSRILANISPLANPNSFSMNTLRPRSMPRTTTSNALLHTRYAAYRNSIEVYLHALEDNLAILGDKVTHGYTKLIGELLKTDITRL